ncbi:hypothetical protein MFMK1_001220 [Metallumcola ferriviriculae]|uniref:Uncharacterized protein n=1 Tax=Metallumcola ferriviriculae TaxID=3039180 RepID=A0AAU0UML2_9FIRM|nr:hypothetical protein MFMK1_001220 [Desulfitibacteraceae bacterium MK1]
MCPYVRKGQNINGWYYYCDAVAMGIVLTAEELMSIGCTDEQRKICKMLMELAVGTGIVPQPAD